MLMLRDRYGRKIDYLRISVTDRCNLRCIYCMPESGIVPGNRREILNFEEIEKVAEVAIGLGLNKIRITGGEPLVRRDLVNLIGNLSKIRLISDLSMTTNGTFLGDYAQSLKEAGLERVNISLDTVNREKFKEITCVDSLDRVIDGIRAACDNFETVKINTVAIRGVNDDEFADLIDFANGFGIDIRFIEYMPTRYGERRDSGYISAAEMLDMIPYNLRALPRNGSAPAKDYIADELTSKVGFITSVSQPFCHSCDRIRLTSDGSLYTCLFSNRSVNLFSMLEENPKLDAAEIYRFAAGKEFAAEKVSLKMPLGEPEYRPSFSEIGG